MTQRIFAYLVSACLCALSVPSLQAQANDLVHMDVVEGWQTRDGKHIYGLRIDVAKGWKTYWRSPGETGIPPRFDWSASENVAGVRVLWPRPEVFESYGQRTLGYSGVVILPVEVTPKDPSRPMQLAGNAEIGVCSDICVAVAETYVSSGDDASDAIRAAIARQPDPSGIRKATCHVAPIEDGLRVTASLSVASQGRDEIAVVELADGDVWVSEPMTERDGTRLVAVADLVPPSARPFALDRSKLRITVLGKDGATETNGCPAN